MNELSKSMLGLGYATVIALALAGIGCGDDGGPGAAGDDDDDLFGDAGPGAGDDDDDVGDDDDDDGPDCSAGLSGDVRTNRPDLEFIRTDGPLEMTNANVRFVPSDADPSRGGVLVDGELVNRDTEIHCTVFVDLFVGAIELLAIADAPPYATGSTVATECVGPGESLGFTGITADATRSGFDAAASVRYATDTFTFGFTTPIPHPNRPTILSSDIVGSAPDQIIQGQARTIGAIRNLSFAFYPRNECNVVLERMQAFNLEPIPSAFTFDYETFPFSFAEERIADVGLVMTGFIDDSAPGLSRPRTDRERAHHARRVAVREARRRLHTGR